MTRSFGIIAAAALFGMVAYPGTANSQSRIKIGVLDCDISGGIGMIIASRKSVTCQLAPTASGPHETYVGTISKFGLDVGATSSGRMVWTVYSATRGEPVSSIAGRYAGASAEATIGAGLGANVLVGGSNSSIALQPVSVQGQTGLNLALGVAGLELRRAP